MSSLGIFLLKYKKEQKNFFTQIRSTLFRKLNRDTTDNCLPV